VRALLAGRKSTDEGWTFVEILIALGIVLILTATVAFMFIRYLSKAKVVAAKSQIEAMEMALQAYYLDSGNFPTQEQGLAALWEKPSLSPVPETWDGPYMAKRLPKDPWNNDYIYLVPGPGGNPYGIATYGSDGAEGGSGEASDVVSW
jgi:general secretion pathway protein G